MNLREEIAEEFDNCMGYHEGIRVPDFDEGFRAIDFADKVLKLFEKRIDEHINNFQEFDKAIGGDITSKAGIIALMGLKEEFK